VQNEADLRQYYLFNSARSALEEIRWEKIEELIYDVQNVAGL